MCNLGNSVLKSQTIEHVLLCFYVTLFRLTLEGNGNLGRVYAHFAKAESAFLNADYKRRFKTPFIGVLFILTFPEAQRRADFANML